MPQLWGCKELDRTERLNFTELKFSMSCGKYQESLMNYLVL